MNIAKNSKFVCILCTFLHFKQNRHCPRWPISQRACYLMKFAIYWKLVRHVFSVKLQKLSSKEFLWAALRFRSPNTSNKYLRCVDSVTIRLFLWMLLRLYKLAYISPIYQLPEYDCNLQIFKAMKQAIICISCFVSFLSFESTIEFHRWMSSETCFVFSDAWLFM